MYEKPIRQLQLGKAHRNDQPIPAAFKVKSNFGAGVSGGTIVGIHGGLAILQDIEPGTEVLTVKNGYLPIKTITRAVTKTRRSLSKMVVCRDEKDNQRIAHFGLLQYVIPTKGAQKERPDPVAGFQLLGTVENYSSVETKVRLYEVALPENDFIWTPFYSFACTATNKEFSYLRSQRLNS